MKFLHLFFLNILFLFASTTSAFAQNLIAKSKIESVSEVNGASVQHCDMALELSDSFNDNSATIKKIKVALPNPKISKKGTLINGIRFKSTEEKGRSALILRNKLLPSEKSQVDIKISENQARARYFYFI